MSGEIEFTFEELPLIVDLGFEAGLVNGSATIAYESHFEWFVREIRLDGHRQRTPAERADETAKTGKYADLFERKPVVIDRNERSWLYLSILDQLENGRFKVSVESAIYESIEADRQDAADDRRDRIRDERAEHSTLNRAQQGV